MDIFPWLSAFPRAMASLAVGMFMNFSFHRNPSLTASNAIIPRIGHNYVFGSGITVSLNSSITHFVRPNQFRSSISSPEQDLKHLSWVTLAVGSGVEASISDPKENELVLKNVKVVVESQDEENIQVRVDLTGEQTDRAFNDVLKIFARTGPPVPGFRRAKGGTTPDVPKSFLLQILGRDRVTKFTIKEILSTTMADYVSKENLAVKKRFNTTQTEEELLSAFSPGSDFGFNVTMEIEKTDSEEDGSLSSATDDPSSSDDL